MVTMTFLSTVITSGAELVAYHNQDMQGGEEEQLPIQRRYASMLSFSCEASSPLKSYLVLIK